MADNVSIKDASDASKPIATDEVGGAHHQLVKVEFGADGSATPVSSVNPLPVTVASLPLPSGAATQTTLAAVLAAMPTDPATQTTLAAVLAALQAGLSVTFPSAQSVSISGTPTVALGNITNQTYAETTTALGSNATFTGSSRSAGSTTAYTRFIARALADQSGTFYIEYSPNNSTWYTHSSVAVTANTVAELACNVVTQYHRVRFVNGATAQGSLAIHSALVKV